MQWAAMTANRKRGEWLLKYRGCPDANDSVNYEQPVWGIPATAKLMG